VPRKLAFVGGKGVCDQGDRSRGTFAAVLKTQIIINRVICEDVYLNLIGIKSLFFEPDVVVLGVVLVEEPATPAYLVGLVAGALAGVGEGVVLTVVLRKGLLGGRVCRGDAFS